MRVCPEYSLYFAVLRIKYIWICFMECYLFLFQQVESRSQKFPQVRLIKLTISSVTSETNWEQNQNHTSHIKLYLRASAQPHLFSQTHEEIKRTNVSLCVIVLYTVNITELMSVIHFKSGLFLYIVASFSKLLNKCNGVKVLYSLRIRTIVEVPWNENTPVNTCCCHPVNKLPPSGHELLLSLLCLISFSLIIIISSPITIWTERNEI